MIVTIANAKGGVAKTTSAIYLAAAYARRFEEGATVLDADPQSSASLWRDMAEENGGWPAGTDVMPANLSTLQRLARAGHGGFAVVDAPPQGRLFEESVKAADFVVVPTSDSPIDLQQAWATMNAIPDGKPGAVLIVRAEPRTRAFQATVAALDEAGTPRFDAVVCKRQDIKAGMGHSPRQAPRVPPGARRDRRSDGGARMRNLDMAFRPAARTRSVSGMADVFRSDQTGEWSKTSVSMRPETRRRLKTYAAAHDMRIQEVIDLALEAYLA